MVRYSPVQTNFVNGELDPALEMRPDLKAYGNGADKIRNALVIPQGGTTRRPGLKYVDTLPYTLSQTDLTGTVTAPNGGTAGNAIDDDLTTALTTTGAVGTTNPYVIAHVDLGSASTLKFIDVYDLATDGSVASAAEVRWQYSDDNAAWTDVGDPFDSVTTTAITRRVTPDSSHRYWRLVRVGATDLSTQVFTLNEIEFFTETSTVSNVEVIDFEFSSTQLYTLTITDRNVSVHSNDTFQVDIPIPHLSADINEITWGADLDTVLLFHEDYPTRRIQRQGANDEWQSDEWSFLNMPTNTFDNDTTGNNLTLSAATVGAGRTFTAASAIFDNTMDDDPPHHIVGIDGGRAVVTGFTSSTVLTCEITEEFDGTAISGGEWFLQEPVWSAARGYPRSGTFFQGRLWLAGAKSLPNWAWASRSGAPHDFNTLKTLDSYAIELEVSAKDVPKLSAIFAGRHLQLFSSTAEFYIPVSENTAITPTNAVARRSTGRGSTDNMPVFEIDGATIFLQRGGKAVREFLYVEGEQAYTAGNLSLLASHLITSPVDMALRKSTSTEEADYLYLVNSTGTLAVFCTLRDQEVNGWSLCKTDGSFKAAAGLLEDSYFAIERTIDGTAVLFLEKFDSDLHFDAALSGGVASSAAAAHLDGETVGIRLDDNTQPDQTVASGSVTFARASEVDYEMGLNFPDVTEDFAANDPDYDTGFEVFVRTMTPEGALPEGTQLHKKKKLSNINARVADTLGLYINGYYKTTRTFGSGLLDAAGNPVSELIECKSNLGWSKEARVTVGQKDAHPFTLYGLAYDVGV